MTFKINAAHLIYVFCTVFIATLGRKAARALWKWMVDFSDTFRKMAKVVEGYEGTQIKADATYRVVNGKYPLEMKRSLRDVLLNMKRPKVRAATAGNGEDES